jgi:hypothetical protein
MEILSLLFDLLQQLTGDDFWLVSLAGFYHLDFVHIWLLHGNFLGHQRLPSLSIVRMLSKLHRMAQIHLVIEKTPLLNLLQLQITLLHTWWNIGLRIVASIVKIVFSSYRFGALFVLM